MEEMIKNLPDKNEQSWEEINKLFIDLLSFTQIMMNKFIDKNANKVLLLGGLEIKYAKTAKT